MGPVDYARGPWWRRGCRRALTYGQGQENGEDSGLRCKHDFRLVTVANGTYSLNLMPREEDYEDGC
jgi:hypothetical protein